MDSGAVWGESRESNSSQFKTNVSDLREISGADERFGSSTWSRICHCL